MKIVKNSKNRKNPSILHAHTQKQKESNTIAGSNGCGVKMLLELTTIATVNFHSRFAI